MASVRRNALAHTKRATALLELAARHVDAADLCEECAAACNADEEDQAAAISEKYGALCDEIRAQEIRSAVAGAFAEARSEVHLHIKSTVAPRVNLDPKKN